MPTGSQRKYASAGPGCTLIVMQQLPRLQCALHLDPQLKLSVQVLTPGASQADVYESAVSGIVDDVLEGFNGTIMAYGQVRQGSASVDTRYGFHPGNGP